MTLMYKDPWLTPSYPPKHNHLCAEGEREQKQPLVTAPRGGHPASRQGYGQVRHLMQSGCPCTPCPGTLGTGGRGTSLKATTNHLPHLSLSFCVSCPVRRLQVTALSQVGLLPGASETVISVKGSPDTGEDSDSQEMAITVRNGVDPAINEDRGSEGSSAPGPWASLPTPAGPPRLPLGPGPWACSSPSRVVRKQ